MASGSGIVFLSPFGRASYISARLHHHFPRAILRLGLTFRVSARSRIRCQNAHFNQTIASGPRPMVFGCACALKMGEPSWRAAVPRAAINSRSATREPSGTPARLGFPKSARILKASEFRKVYQEGMRVAGQYFAAFCLRVPRAAGAGPRLGFTVPRAFGR
jgi:hypothetical protein